MNNNGQHAVSWYPQHSATAEVLRADGIKMREEQDDDVITQQFPAIGDRMDSTRNQIDDLVNGIFGPKTGGGLDSLSFN